MGAHSAGKSYELNEFRDTVAESGNGADRDLRLLTNVQAYLEFLSADAVPDSVLTEAWEEFYPALGELIRDSASVASAFLTRALKFMGPAGLV